MPLRAISPLSPRSLNFRLIASFFGILLLIFSIGNIITIQLAREQLERVREERIATQRETFRTEIAEAEARLSADLQAQLNIIVRAVRGPLQSQISMIRDESDQVEERVVQQFSDCLSEQDAGRAYQCIKIRAHHFSIDSIDLINRLMIKTSIELLLSREELVAVEVLDWEDRLFDGYALDQDGALSRLRERFASPERLLSRLEQSVIEDDYLGRVIFHYHTDSIEALRRKADAAIAGLIKESERNARTATQHLTRMRLIEGTLLFALSLLAISLITLFTIIQPLRQLTRHAETMARGDFAPLGDATTARQDELGILIRAFNLMSEQIRRSHQWLQAANEQLEQKVEERTRELADKNRQLEALSTTDWLTRISNRVKLESDFSVQLDRARHFGTSFAVLLCDVDYFKRINDTFGHQAGDQVLIELARLLKHSMRQSDQVGRWGGEEFMLILPETSLDDALTLAERLRLMVSRHGFPGGAASVTISVGVSAYRADDTQESLIERADQALYRAKSEGRNRVRA